MGRGRGEERECDWEQLEEQDWAWTGSPVREGAGFRVTVGSLDGQTQCLLVISHRCWSDIWIHESGIQRRGLAGDRRLGCMQVEMEVC